jgi:hypothetical protein
MKITGFIPRTTEKAFVFYSSPEKKSDVRLPKSQVPEFENPSDGKTPVTLDIPVWILVANAVKFKSAGFDLDWDAIAVQNQRNIAVWKKKNPRLYCPVGREDSYDPNDQGYPDDWDISECF